MGAGAGVVCEGSGEWWAGGRSGPVRGALVPQECHVESGLPSATFTVAVRKHAGTRNTEPSGDDWLEGQGRVRGEEEEEDRAAARDFAGFPAGSQDVGTTRNLR